MNPLLNPDNIGPWLVLITDNNPQAVRQALSDLGQNPSEDTDADDMLLMQQRMLDANQGDVLWAWMRQIPVDFDALGASGMVELGPLMTRGRAASDPTTSNIGVQWNEIDRWGQIYDIVFSAPPARRSTDTTVAAVATQTATGFYARYRKWIVGLGTVAAIGLSLWAILHFTRK